MDKTVIVAMSGGVDSSVAALLLKNQGYKVIGVTMQIWPQSDDKSRACCSLEAVNDARRVAWKLDIPHYVMNFRDEFEQKVIQEFCDEYLKGRTPNPCISCNRAIKFESLLQKARALEADYIATGHYVRTKYDQSSGKWQLKTGLDPTKDQSYALFHMTQEQLAHTLFPLGQYHKTAIREMAKEAGLLVADKADSQEICFVEDSYADFLESYKGITSSGGDIIDAAGKKLGRHRGTYRYTIGQSKGLGIALGYPVYVTAIDPATQTIRVGTNDELFHTSLLADRYTFVSGEAVRAATTVTVKIRYNAPKVPATITPLDEELIQVDFAQAQRAITPGQAVVLYDNDVVLGGGTIRSSFNRKTD